MKAALSVERKSLSPATARGPKTQPVSRPQARSPTHAAQSRPGHRTVPALRRTASRSRVCLGKEQLAESRRLLLRYPRGCSTDIIWCLRFIATGGMPACLGESLAHPRNPGHKFSLSPSAGDTGRLSPWTRPASLECGPRSRQAGTGVRPSSLRRRRKSRVFTNVHGKLIMESNVR